MTPEVKNTGIVSNPNVKEETYEEIIYMNIIGYDDSKFMFKCANTLGAKWGDKGYCYVPYNYMLNPKFTGDFCILNVK